LFCLIYYKEEVKYIMNSGGIDGYDTDVSHYSISELLDLVGLGGDGGIENIGETELSTIIEGFVDKYREVDITLSRFFSDVGQRLYSLLVSQDNDNDGHGGREEGLAMRKIISGGGGSDFVDGGGEIAESGGGYDDNMGGVGGGDYGDDDEIPVDPNDIMGLRRDLKRGLVSGSQQLKWERNQYLDDDGEEEEDGRGGGGGGRGGGGGGRGGGGGGGGGGRGNGAYVNRSNKVKIFRDENGHYQMKQKKIGVANSYVIPVAQGTMNPVLRNTLTRIINIDSQFRQSAFPYTSDPTSPTSATSFTVVLTEPLTNVTSLRLNSINIPYTWYAVDSAVGNNVMYVDLNTGVNGIHTITVANGNYTPEGLVAAVRRQIGLNSYLNGSIDISYNTVNGLCFFMNYTSRVISFTFYDAAMIYSGRAAGGCRQSTKLNNSLGWLLGFRNSNYYDGVIMANGALPSGYNRDLNTFEVYGMVYMVLGVTADMEAEATMEAADGGRSLAAQVADSILGLYSDDNPANDLSAGAGWIRGEAIVDCYGPQYFLLIIDDFNHSRVNSGVVGIGEVTTSLATPAYFNADLPDATKCIPDTSDVRNGLKRQKLVVPTVPRTLTFSQIYSFNQITANRGGSGPNKNREMGPKTSDVFAVIPLRTGAGAAGLSMGQHYIDSGPTLLSNQRAYFGPVVINKLRVTLRDDKGHIVNLHGNDWSFSLVTEELYEF
jgi:hypothetical protein